VVSRTLSYTAFNFCFQFNLCHYTLEVSFYSPPPQQESWSALTSNEESYEAFGRGIAYSFTDYYGREVQVHPKKPALKAPGSWPERLKMR